jgi:hypothetical protein
LLVVFVIWKKRAAHGNGTLKSREHIQIFRSKFMGWGSSGPPPWVDEEKQRKLKAEKDAKQIEALTKENEALKKRVKQLEDELKKVKNIK